MKLPWRDAMEQALYGPGGFFVAGTGPAANFRTSVHASPVFARSLLRLITHVDTALNFPDPFDVVDVGAGRGELLRALSAGVTLGVSGEPTRSGPALGSDTALVPLAQRVRFTAVELAPRPGDLPEQINWAEKIPAGIIGLLIATEWLDNVPLDLAIHTPEGWHYLLVDPTSGADTTGGPVSEADADWLNTWWPLPTDSAPTTARAEIGRTRDEAWADAVGHVDRGLALAVDYGHLRGDRPVDGSLTGYRGGRQVPPVPDGSCDVTAHVAMDSVASAGARVGRCAYFLGSQREGLRALGADGGRPPLSLAARDPAEYVRALAEASAVAELTDPAGLGGHWWLWQPVGLPADRLPLPA
ncbi:SAM-dependent methyltransferase [Micromonospora sp. NPDC051296]|uniref:SAM-dependent methyltransferase n=1 Tax=Micromonospora sp. NPDC051296 TaxID=3155046 RepID=UPI00343B121B